VRALNRPGRARTLASSTLGLVQTNEVTPNRGRYSQFHAPL
jgi:hypothetical protein